MKYSKTNLIILLLILTNILLLFSTYKLYNNNKTNIRYIEQNLKSTIIESKSLIESIIYYSNEFIKDEKAHYSEIEMFRECSLMLLISYGDLIEIAHAHGFTNKNIDDNNSYRYYLSNSRGSLLLNFDILKDSEDGFVIFDEYQLSFLEELSTLLKDYKEHLVKVSNETNLYSDDWVEFVSYLLKR